VRDRLRLPGLPVPFILGAALLSYPGMFEIERGNCDVLPLLAVALLLPALASRLHDRLTGVSRVMSFLVSSRFQRRFYGQKFVVAKRETRNRISWSQIEDIQNGAQKSRP
jgi:hypothetical protein